MTNMETPVAGWCMSCDVVGLPRPEPRPRFTQRETHVYVPTAVKHWKREVRAAVSSWLRQRPDTRRGLPLSGALRVTCQFFYVRPKSHFTARGALGKKAPGLHTQTPDADNLAKAVLDALQAWDGLDPLVYWDDSATVDLHASKHWARRGDPGGVRILIEQIDDLPTPEPLMTTKMPKLAALRTTSGERFELHRRRQGWTQQEAARAYGVSVNTVRRFERGERIPDVFPSVNLGHIAPGEWCHVVRRRLGLTVREVAGMLDTSVAWVTRTENHDNADDNRARLALLLIEKQREAADVDTLLESIG